MPIYEYQCTVCHHHFDVMQKINEQPLQQCPKCLDNSLVKLVSAAGFQLKGSGWYETDFKTKNTAPKDSSDKKQEPAVSADTAPAAENTAKKSTDNSAGGNTE